MKITERLVHAWKGLTGQADREIQANIREILSMRSRLAATEIELHKRSVLVSSQKSKLEAIEASRTDSTAAIAEDLFVALAAPLSQLRMQAWLMGSGKEISGRSVMALAAQIASLVQRAGLEPVGEPGERIRFDPELHQPLSAQERIECGASAVVRFPGYRYRGRILRRALVQG
ncbi:MAG: hypothetical protein AB1646_05075 [Thermodesulfobacteriota bacterium]